MSDSAQDTMSQSTPAGKRAPQDARLSPRPGGKIIIKDQPMGLYMPSLQAEGVNRYGQRCSEIFKRCVAKAKEGQTLSKEDMEELKYYPEAYRSLAYFPPTRDLVLEQVFTVPKVALDLIIHDYENAREYESSLFCYPEEIYRLLVWGKETGTSLKFPKPLYQSLLLEDITWAVRWYKETQDDDYAMHIMGHVEENHMFDPGAACLYLKLNADDPVIPYQSVLKDSLKYAYIACRLFADRGLDVSTVSFLGLGVPQWAYHYLRDFPDNINQEQAEKTLLKDPLWLAEYLSERPHPRMRELCEECIAKVSDHPLIPDLQEWLRLEEQRRLETK